MRFSTPSVIAVVGFCSSIFGLLCSSLIFPKLENFLIAKATALQEGSKAFESWKKIPFPFKLKVYFFNVTNPDDVQIGLKPILKQVGPYVYDELREREIVVINEANDTIKYIQRKKYYFNQDESGCRAEDDIVTIIHFALISMAHKINNISPMALSMLNDALPYLYPNFKNAFITNSVRNILFNGIEILCESEEVDMICDGLRSNLPHTIRIANNNRDFLLSLFHHLNGTEDGPYEIGRGLKNTIKGEVIYFKDSNLMAQWNNHPCNKIRGTDLTINPSFPKIPKKIDFFVPDFCRSFSVYFQKEMNYLGLQSYYFKSECLFDKVSCFCDQNIECPPAGTMGISPCTGSPIVISQPHFLNAETSLLAFTQGLEPNKDKHETFIIMEPKTGLALKVKTRFQMNIFLKRYEDVNVLGNVSEGFFPFLWLENGAEVPLDIIEEVKSNFSKLKIFDVLKYFLIIGGIILLGVSLILAMVKDKIFSFCGRKNVISNERNIADRRFMDMYSDIKNGISANNSIGYVWKITE